MLVVSYGVCMHIYIYAGKPQIYHIIRQYQAYGYLPGQAMEQQRFLEMYSVQQNQPSGVIILSL